MAAAPDDSWYCPSATNSTVVAPGLDGGDRLLEGDGSLVDEYVVALGDGGQCELVGVALVVAGVRRCELTGVTDRSDQVGRFTGTILHDHDKLAVDVVDLGTRARPVHCRDG